MNKISVRRKNGKLKNVTMLEQFNKCEKNTLKYFKVKTKARSKRN